MRILAILLFCGILYAGTPTQDWYGIIDRITLGDTTWIQRPMVKAQKDFAFKCIEWGEKNYGLGHTLAGIAWMESSLGADTDHAGGNSKGPWGISPQTYASTNGLSGRLRPWAGSEEDFLSHIRGAAIIYLENARYIRQWHKNRSLLPISDRRVWQYGPMVGRGGTNWQNRAQYGRVFRTRVAFLRTLTGR